MNRPRVVLLPLAALVAGFGCSGPLAGRAPRQASFRLTFAFTAKGKTNWVRVVALVPRDIPGRQVVHEVRLSPQPVRVFDLGENRYAEFFLHKPPRSFQVEVAGRATVFLYDLELARQSRRPERAGPLQPYLIAEPLLECDDSAIQEAASRIQGEGEVETIRRIYDFVVATMRYTGMDPSPTGGGAVRALREKGGDCTDYADLMVALCRAKGIPARPCLGLYSLPTADTPKHSWVEVHTSRFGWVPFDPTTEDTGQPGSFERLKAHYLRFSTLRNDELLDNFSGYMMYRWWGDRIELSESLEVRLLARRPGDPADADGTTRREEEAR